MAAVEALWLVVGLVLLIGVAFIIYLIYKATSGNQPFQPKPCSEDLSGLPYVSQTPCCYFNGANSTWKYDADINMIITPDPSYYLNVCIGFCPQGSFNAVKGTCDTTDKTALTAFKQCVDLLEPKQCKGSAMPVAISGSMPYYGYQAGKAGCNLCCPCGAQECNPSAC